MKKSFLISGLFILILAVALISFRNVWAQSNNQSSDAGDIQAIKDKLDKIESDIQVMLENQEKMFVELRRGRYFTKRS